MKKPYKKPEIKKVQLKPEESVLTKCKQKWDSLCEGVAKTAHS
jgi:hypothetical protein